MGLEASAGGEKPPASSTARFPPGGDSARKRRLAVGGLVASVLVATGFVAYAVAISRQVPASRYANLILYASPAKVPQFGPLARLGGGASITSAMLAGSPAVVNWFESGCVACQAELGTFASVADRHGWRIRFLGVDINDPSPALALTMVRRAKADYPVAQAPGLGSISLATRFGVGDLPATVFVDSSGDILGEVLGKIPPSELMALFGNLVAGRPLNS